MCLNIFDHQIHQIRQHTKSSDECRRIYSRYRKADGREALKVVLGHIKIVSRYRYFRITTLAARRHGALAYKHNEQAHSNTISSQVGVSYSACVMS